MDLILKQPLIVLFGIIFLGIAIGNIKVKGLSLGLSGVLFVALVAGNFHLKIPAGVGNLGLALFVYCVGLSAGNRFFSALANQGGKLVFLSLLIVACAAVCTIGCGELFSIPGGISSGIFAGACTSTPALAAASEVLENLTGQSAGVSIGYGIAYPFGVVGVVLFVQLLPRLLKIDLNKEAFLAEKHSGSKSAIVTKLVRVSRQDLEDMPIASCQILDDMNCRATRIVREGRLVPLKPEDKLVCGTEILVVGTDDSLTIAGMTLGQVLDNPYAIDSCNERRELILTSPDYAGQTLRHADPLDQDHIIISRISRLGFTFIPNGNTILERNDILTVVGNPTTIDAYATKIGHRSTAINATDLMSLGFGLCLGILLGMVKIGIGEDASLSLGIAGGPLVVALLLGHFGKIGPFVGYIPRPTRVLLQDLGLVFFLAGAGIAGGDDLINTVSKYGATVFIMGMIVTTVPLLVGYWTGMKFFKMNILECLGGICGGMTSTPALGTLTAKTDSQLPVVSYATAYPAALILMTLGAKLIISLLGV